RMPGIVRIPRTTREGHDDRHFELRRETHRFAKLVVVRLRGAPVWMEWVAMARQRADRQARIIQFLPEGRRALRVGGERLDVHMIVARPAARAELERLDFSEGPHLREHLVERKFAEDRRKKTKFHASLYVRTAVQTPPRRWPS